MNIRLGSDQENKQLVIFKVSNGEFGMPISSVREIIHVSKLVVLPDMPLSMVGIINVRGTVLPVIDLGRRFNMPQNEPTNDPAERKVLLVEMNDSMVGYLVDSVSEVMQVPAKSVESLDDISSLKIGIINAICNLGDRLIPIVDASRLLTGEETKELQAALAEEVVHS